MRDPRYGILPIKIELSSSDLLDRRRDDLRYIGGLRMGYAYKEFFVTGEIIHQNVAFSGYPIGGITMDMALFGSVEDLRKAQRPDRVFPNAVA